MPNPTVSDVHVNSTLTNMSVAFAQDASQFIAGQVFPEVPSSERSDEFFIYSREDWFRIEAKKRAGGTRAARGGYDLNRDSYYIERYSLADAVDDLTVANADDALSPFEDATNYVTENMLRLRERAWSQGFFGTGVWSTDLDGVAGAPGAGQFQQWDQSGSSPIDDIDSAGVDMLELTGRKPNTIVTTPRVFKTLKNHAEILERIKYTGGPTRPAMITAEALAGLFGVDRFLISEAVSNVAGEGVAEDEQFILGKHLLLAHVAATPGRRIPSAGYTFVWTGLFGAGPNGSRIKRYRDEPEESDVVEIDATWDMKVVAADLGAFFENAVA